MAQSYQTDSATLKIPGAYPETKVESQGGGAAATGVIAIVGEADAGPHWSKETSLNDNAFGPDQLDSVIAKYGSGNIVEAFRASTSPMNDPEIQGSFNRIVVVKTNDSGLASLDLGGYATASARQYGKAGNLISIAVANAVAMVNPSVTFAFVPPVGTVNAELRADGGAATSIAVTALMTPTAFVAAVGARAAGGVDDSIVGGATNATVANPTTTSITISASVDWGTTPTVGGTLVIPTGSAIAGAGSANVGSYVITAAASRSVTAVKVANRTGSPGDPIIPVATVAAPTAITDADLITYTPVTISGNGVEVAGQAKSLEIADVASGTDQLTRCIRILSAGVPVAATWISLAGSPQLITGVERQVALTSQLASAGITETFTAGGDVAFEVGYKGTSASLTISDNAFSVTVVGGAGASIPSTSFKDLPTIADLVAFLKAKAGFTAAVGTALLGALPTSALDDGTFNIATTQGENAGMIKVDFYKLTKAVNQGSTLVTLSGTGGGLPAVTSTTFLTGGTKGGSTQAAVQAALDAAEKVRCNFVVPLFSRDATEDILDGLTEVESTYVIDSINDYGKAHVLKMSTIKRRRHRQAFLSKLADFDTCRNASANNASFRCSMTFEDVKNVSSNGTVQFQPWMGAVVAAASQAAGGYKAIFGKTLNISGAVMEDGSYTWEDSSQTENALDAGLLPIGKAEDNSGWEFTSDQTCYGKDENFVYNSIQAVYAMDTIALESTRRMERRYKGKSVADVSAAIAYSYLEGVLDSIRTDLKLIAPSDDAKKGYKNLKIKIVGPALLCTFEVKLAGAIYFIPMTILVQPVVQTAG